MGRTPQGHVGLCIYPASYRQYQAAVLTYFPLLVIPRLPSPQAIQTIAS